MKGTHEVTDRTDRRAITEFLKQEGQFLLPMVKLGESAELAIDNVIEMMGRATIEAVLEMSAEGVAGPKQAGLAPAECSFSELCRISSLKFVASGASET